MLFWSLEDFSSNCHKDSPFSDALETSFNIAMGNSMGFLIYFGEHTTPQSCFISFFLEISAQNTFIEAEWTCSSSKTIIWLFLIRVTQEPLFWATTGSLCSHRRLKCQKKTVKSGYKYLKFQNIKYEKYVSNTPLLLLSSSIFTNPIFISTLQDR